MTEYTPEAEALGRVLWPGLQLSNRMLRNAQRAIDAGWTPPPDPHEDIARALHVAVYGELCEDGCHAERDLLDAVRRIPLPLARQVAAALEADQ